jgi:hypothetical protein
MLLQFYTDWLFLPTWHYIGKNIKIIPMFAKIQKRRMRNAKILNQITRWPEL